ncbi:hypothetical protein SAMN05443549_11115 [Flavobacterium fluvii]|uniref:Uncharacterized protein n=1 Tax=Flavobacterium fluvii TaxID=468056 RepID=A0A1M5PK74_9FLAO|nr:hypothetical protein SAMN05443549_11115 [Flavobacterium fluvii]
MSKLILLTNLVLSKSDNAYQNPTTLLYILINNNLRMLILPLLLKKNKTYLYKTQKSLHKEDSFSHLKIKNITRLNSFLAVEISCYSAKKTQHYNPFLVVFCVPKYLK